VGLGDAAVIAARELGASDADVALIARLKARAAEFERARAELERMGGAVAFTHDEATERAFAALLDRADVIRRRIAAALAAVDNGLRTARGAIGADAVRELSTSGLVWLVPGAVTLAATSVIGAWLVDYQRFVERFTSQQRIAGELERSGMAAVEAQRTAAEAVAADAPTLLDEYGKPLAIVAALAVGWYLWRHFQGAR
jgi:hypothetical protein